MTQLDVFARAGVPVINDALTLFRAQNKLTDSSMLTATGSLHYPVISGKDTAELRRWIEEINAPVVLKPLVGYGGRGLQRLSDMPDDEGIIWALEQHNEAYYAMPWIDNPGRDIRIYTVNHRAVFAMYRYAREGKWITNVRAGGLIAMCPLTAELIEVAERASRGAGTLIGGIDIAENQATGGLVVYEVNSCPTCEPPALEAVADFLAAAALDLEEARARWRPRHVYTDYDASPDLFHPSKHEQLKPAD